MSLALSLLLLLPYREIHESSPADIKRLVTPTWFVNPPFVVEYFGALPRETFVNVRGLIFHTNFIEADRGYRVQNEHTLVNVSNDFTTYGPYPEHGLIQNGAYSATERFV